MIHTLLFRCSLLLLALLLLPGMGRAQRDRSEDVLYLKNGSIIRGQIVDQEVGRQVRIKIFGGSIFVFEASEIDRIAGEPALYRSITLKMRRELIPFYYPSLGMYHLVSFDLGFAKDWWGLLVTPALRYRAGYRFHRYLGLEMGSGFDFYEDGAMLIPLFAGIRGDVVQKPVAPHYFFHAGYGFAGARGWNMVRLDGGLLGQAGAGIKIHTRRRSAWILSSGFRFQQTYQEFNRWTGLPEPVLVQGRLRYNRIFVEFAMSL